MYSGGEASASGRTVNVSQCSTYNCVQNELSEVSTSSIRLVLARSEGGCNHKSCAAVSRRFNATSRQLSSSLHRLAATSTCSSDLCTVL